MPIVLAGLAAAVFGVADFLGGTASRRVPPPRVAVLAQVAGMVGLLLVVFALPGAPLPSSLGWGLLAGLSGGVGVPVLYRALARGPMNVVAPLAALTSASVPVLLGTLLGDRPSVGAWVGIALAMLAGVVVGMSVEPDRDVHGDPGRQPGTARARRSAVGGVLMSLFAGLCFGGFFVLIAQVDPAAGLWPVAAAKVGGSLVAVAAVLALARRARVHAGTASGERIVSGERIAGAVSGGDGPTRAGWPLAVLGGVLDALANVLFLLAARHGQLAVVGAVVGLYPASTVLLARLLHGERIGALQRVGLAIAVPALVLVGAG